jgi:hypothetical protein
MLQHVAPSFALVILSEAKDLCNLPSAPVLPASCINPFGFAQRRLFGRKERVLRMTNCEDDKLRGRQVTRESLKTAFVRKLLSLRVSD